MAGESDIRAGGAFVEIGAKLNPLAAALSKATGMMHDWGAKIAGMGARMTAAGGAMVAPVAMAMKTFAAYGNEMANLAASTGLASQTLAGLRMQALNNNIAFAAVKTGIRQMQVAIADGTTETGEAFAKLGLDVSQLQGLAPEQQFEILADRIAAIQDPAEKATAAFRLFGRGGVELIPILNEGRAGMQAAQREASKFGLVLSGEAMQKALATDAALNKLGNAFTGLKLRLAEAASGMLPLIDQASDLIARVGVMLQQNPKLVESWANIGLAIAAAGTAFVVLGGAIMAATSPAFLITGALMLIGGAVLAVLDTLGVTDTGFADLFNSIQVNGLGLADWFTWFWEHITAGWTVFMNGLAQAWITGWGLIKDLGHGAYQFILEIVELMAFAVDSSMGGIVDGINTVLKAYNAAAGIISDKAQVSLVDKPAFTGDMLDAARGENDKNRNGWDADRAESKAMIRALQQDSNKALETFGKNVTAIERRSTGESGISVNKGAAIEALGKIGGGLGEWLRGMFADLIGQLPELPEYSPAKSSSISRAGTAGIKGETSFEAAGTFLGGYGALMTSNGRLLDLTQRSADAAERTARATEAMAAGGDSGGPEMS